MLAGACAFAAAAHADIEPISSSLSVRAVADVDPDDFPDTAVTDSRSTGPVFENFTLSALASDGAPPQLFERVVANASVAYFGADTIRVQFTGSREGTDMAIDGPGGQFESFAAYRMRFENLAPGQQITVAWSLNFERDSEGTFAPFGIALRSLLDFDSRGLGVPFDALSGTASGSETFQLASTGFSGVYTLELDLALSGRTTDLNQFESWDVTFVVTTPTMTITPVPEPALPALFLAGLGAVALRQGMIRRTRPRTGS